MTYYRYLQSGDGSVFNEFWHGAKFSPRAYHTIFITKISLLFEEIKGYGRVL